MDELLRKDNGAYVCRNRDKLFYANNTRTFISRYIYRPPDLLRTLTKRGIVSTGEFLGSILL
mgnify:CR=1 FL=1